MAEKEIAEKEKSEIKVRKYVAVEKCYINETIYQPGDEFTHNGPLLTGKAVKLADDKSKLTADEKRKQAEDEKRKADEDRRKLADDDRRRLADDERRRNDERNRLLEDDK
jgi:hypothetical protein